MQKKKKPAYLKSRGYLHLTPKLDLSDSEIIAKVGDPRFVAHHDFFPLLHTNIKERRFKKSAANGLPIRAHAFRNEQGRYVHNAKIRPLHYATHIDAVIFGYYADMLNRQYERVLRATPELSACITAYRSLPHETLPRNKSTIDFAKDVFTEIKSRAEQADCVVLTFDLEKFFSSLNHKYLKKAWYQLLGKITLPPDHYNVFKASTNFSYILLDDLRIGKNRSGKRLGFDEKKIAQNRTKGIDAYFENVQELREKIISKELLVYKNPFYDKERQVKKGIPQGLPISAVLANLYLLEFDTSIYQELVLKKQAFYRRYSDDIVIICKPEDCEGVEDFINTAIKNYFVSVSADKTERFIFKKESATNSIISYKYSTGKEALKRAPLLYLGFEFYGHKTLIKSANLAKFYRRMISTVKRGANRMHQLEAPHPEHPPVLFKRKLYKLYSAYGKKRKPDFSPKTVLKQNYLGEFRLMKEKRRKPVISRGNYISYVERASNIMEEPAIKRQVRKHWQVLKAAIVKHVEE